MDALLQLIATYGLLVVFVAVFLDQGGLPLAGGFDAWHRRGHPVAREA